MAPTIDTTVQDIPLNWPKEYQPQPPYSYLALHTPQSPTASPTSLAMINSRMTDLMSALKTV